MYRTSYRIYYEDTDAAGVVYYANYLKFAERARTDALRECGIHQKQLLDEQGLGFVVSRAAIDFKQGARLDDVIDVRIPSATIGKVKIEMTQEIWRDDSLLASIDVVIAMVNSDFKPARIPDKIRDALQNKFVS